MSLSSDRKCDVEPLEISEASFRPPHSDRVTSGRSPEESDRHSVPLSAAALPTDCGDWEPERCPFCRTSTQCLGTSSDSLKSHSQKLGYFFFQNKFLILYKGSDWL